MKRLLLVIMGVLTLLTARCNSPVISQTATITAILTPTEPLTPTVTEAPEATHTLEATATSALTPKPATKTPTSTPDFYMTVTAVVRAVVAAGQPRIYASYLSPDKYWRAEAIIYDCIQVFVGDTNAYEQLKIIHVSDGTESVVADQLQFCGGVGAYGLEGLYWSPNSRYFYFTGARESVPDGLCGYWARPIRRVDVMTQQVEFVGGGHLSPDKSKLALWQDHTIVIWSLDEGEVARIPATVPDVFNNEISWSPDSRSLVYLQTAIDCWPFGKSYITLLDLPGLTPTLLLESESPRFTRLTWGAPNRISLMDDKGNKWRYNLVSHELRPVP